MFIIKKILILFSFLVLIGCDTEDNRRSLTDAETLSESYLGFDTLHFVVQANCDYDYFFEYEPMRPGGYYAYGYKNNLPKLLIIPKYSTDDVKLIDWPINYSVSEAAYLLNSAINDTILNEDNMYSHVLLELTPSILNTNQNTTYDVPFFIVFSINDVNYIAFQQDLNLVIYHEDDGLIISND